jgi:hypothetical protein
MPAFVLVEVSITDAAGYERYKPRFCLRRRARWALPGPGRSGSIVGGRPGGGPSCRVGVP